MLKLFNRLLDRKAEVSGLVGLSVSEDRISLAHISRDRGEVFLEQCVRIESEGRQLKELLHREVAERDLQRAPCNFVLAPRDYNLYLIEAPLVEADELKAAVRWKVKDLIDVPAEEAVIEVFPVPEDAFKGRSKMLYAVVAQKARIEQVIELTHRADLELVSIDIPEFAMRNIVQQFANDENGLALLALSNNGSNMNLSRQGNLYLTRRINTQAGDNVMDSADWESQRDRLVLEIQRSLDYYESQMGQNPVSRLLIAPRARDTEAMVRSLDEAMAVQVSALDFGSQLHGSAGITVAARHACLMVIGAALRNEVAA